MKFLTPDCFIPKKRWLAGAVLVTLVLSASLAFATQKPSAKTCQDLGTIEVQCKLCSTGETIGTMTMRAVYDPLENTCNGEYREARTKCHQKYGKSRGLFLKQIAMKAQYNLGISSYTVTYPKEKCKF